MSDTSPEPARAPVDAGPRPFEPIPDLEPVALEQLAKDWHAGLVFSAHHIDPASGLLGSVFLPLGLGGLADWSHEQVETIGTVYEYMSEAGPQSINGYPMFFSFRLLNRGDFEKLTAAVARIKAAVDAAAKVPT